MTTNVLSFSLKATTTTFIILAILNLVGSNLLATKGHQLNTLRQETILLKQENTLLTNQIAQKSSLGSLETWADNNGYIKITQPTTITTPAPVAYNR